MPSATLTVKPAPIAGPDARLFEVDCRHATTQGWLIPGGTGTPADPDLLRALLMKHWIEEGCRCTARLRAEYGVAVVGRDR